MVFNWLMIFEMKMDIYRYLRCAAVAIAAMFASTDAMAEGDATFRWFEYCPGVERQVVVRSGDSQSRRAVRKKKGRRNRTRVSEMRPDVRVERVAPTNCFTDSFASHELSERWSHINEPDDDNYRLTPDGLTLTPTYVNLSNTHYSPTAIFLDTAEGPFVAACQVDYTPSTPHDFAGMALYADAGSTITFGRTIVNGRQAVVVRSLRDGYVTTAYQPLQDYETGYTLWLRMKSYDGEVSFFYSTNHGATWTPVANNLPLPGEAASQAGKEEASPEPRFLLGLYTSTFGN